MPPSALQSYRRYHNNANTAIETHLGLGCRFLEGEASEDPLGWLWEGRGPQSRPREKAYEAKA